ncbi:pseudouridine-5'-phosphate glycosidase [Microbacterium sp.]|uniref:pseudouridine-5'-phosphate glycosidase n=1 Tax=Microbacterium sp. TaxID=51671 RepID=UPI003221421B
MSSAVRVSAEVRDAVASGRPVLALESTIFTHGLPRPRNLEVALESEEWLRASGVTPATIGVFSGELVVGLSTAEIEGLSNDDAVVKASIRDLPIAMAKGLSAGTTVAATAFAAHEAGVRVFSTGGLGGVHRGAPETFDESADLGALAAIPLVVVSAGVKSILDIGLTLERLETLNIPVVGYRTTDYPGFYLADSGFDIDYAADDAAEIARIAIARDALGLPSTVLVANPVPVEQQLDPAVLDAVLVEAHAAAAAGGVIGHDITPFLLDYIQRATDGVSLDVNVHVYRNNVALGAEIARALSAR